MQQTVNFETHATYDPRTSDDDAIISQALAILESRHKPGTHLSSPHAVREYLRLKLGAMEHETFGCIFLDVRHRVISMDDMFRGTLTQAAVYPREVVKSALCCNAQSVILYHNHPSGSCEPSTNDRNLTAMLKQALALVDVKVLDHFVVSSASVYSFAEHGDI